MPDLASPVLTRIEAAAYLRVSPRTFDADVRPVAPPVRIGGRVLFRREDLDARLAEQVKAQEAPATSTATAASSSSSTFALSIVEPMPPPARCISLAEHRRAGRRAMRGGGRG